MKRIKTIFAWYNSTDRDFLSASVLDWRSGSDGYESGWNDCLDKIGGRRR